ncbi:MAG: hypothetical protein ABSC23_21960 [Bryobacteraceae bacterium]
MLRTVRMCVGALLLTLALSGGTRAAAADQAGYALVDKLVLFFNETASSTVAHYDVINDFINETMAQAKAARAEQRVSQEFYDRYTRVLRIFKLRITDDKEGVLAPIADQEYIAFVKAVTGKELHTAPSIAVLAQAVMQELENLKKLLDQQR